MCIYDEKWNNKQKKRQKNTFEKDFNIVKQN